MKIECLKLSITVNGSWSGFDGSMIVYTAAVGDDPITNQDRMYCVDNVIYLPTTVITVLFDRTFNRNNKYQHKYIFNRKPCIKCIQIIGKFLSKIFFRWTTLYIVQLTYLG